VFPGETLRLSVWKNDGGYEAVVTAPERDNAVALAGVEFVPA
ncbi:3-alpha,7-alpha,12-alpha-trihydroxy-5-beta-cholest-24-enoyl-CoA hydratase, partial [Mycobacterium sp. ITM-2017-0098]